MSSMDKFYELMSNESSLLTTVVNCNQYTKQFGLSLSEDEAKELMAERKDVLKKEQRIEFGEGILPKLIFTFCDSPYIYQDNYVDTIERLQEIFYMYKNESFDIITDDELLERMKNEFDGVCHGSLDYLEDTRLDLFINEIKSQTEIDLRNHLYNH